MLWDYSLLVEADIDCHRLAALLLKTVKRMLYLGYGLLRYVLIYNLTVSFNFHSTFLQLDVIRILTVHGYFLRAPDNSNLFRFPLKVRVIGSRLYIDFKNYSTSA